MEDSQVPTILTYEVSQDAEKRYRWRLVTDRGDMIAESGGSYSDYRTCVASIFLVKMSSPAPIVEQTSSDADPLNLTQTRSNSE